MYNHMGGGGPSDCQSTGVCRSTRKGQMSMHQKRRTGSVSLLTGRPGHMHGQLASRWLEKKNEQGRRLGSTMMHACPSDRRRNDACPFPSPSPSFTLSLFHSLASLASRSRICVRACSQQAKTRYAHSCRQRRIHRHESRLQSHSSTDVSDLHREV